MSYSIREIFYTLQGEGAQAGRPSVFCRFSGCNLWSGREADRDKAICQFCDTDFVGTDGERGGRYDSAEALAETIASLWPEKSAYRYVVFTGGEPLLQLDEALINAMHARAFEVGIETNGTLPVPQGIDWICVSPKVGTVMQVTQGDELKLVVPQLAQNLADYAQFSFRHFYVQPMDGDNREANTRLAIALCKANPQWKLSVQTHKYLNIP